LMQIKGDWSWYCEAMGLWQWNSKAHSSSNRLQH